MLPVGTGFARNNALRETKLAPPMQDNRISFFAIAAVHNF